MKIYSLDLFDPFDSNVLRSEEAEIQIWSIIHGCVFDVVMHSNKQTSP